VVAEAEMAGADLDILGQRRRLVEAGAPGDNAVEAAVYRGGGHRQRAATVFEWQGPPFDVPVGVVVEQMPGVALLVAFGAGSGFRA
jgi:hypothetical protein